MILDISKKEHIPIINMYKKCKGISLVDKYLPELSPLNKMYIINSEEEWEQVKNDFPENMMTVRCDCSRGIEGKLLEGQTFHRDRVNQYIRDVKKIVPDAVIILEDLKKNHKLVITLEDGLLDGGFGANIASYYGDADIKVKNYGLKKEFIDRYDVKDILIENRLTSEQIVNDIKMLLV